MMKKWKKSILYLLICGFLLQTCTVFTVQAASCEHKNTEKTMEQPASCTQHGYTEGMFCNDCNKYISGHQVIDALGHIDINNDSVCDDCQIKFIFREAQKETCTKDGYTGDVIKNGRIIIGESVPAPGHKDNNMDFICDTCKNKITKQPIQIVLHYYVTDEEYEKNKTEFSGKNFSVKNSDSVPGCKYITEVRTETQNTEFSVPESPVIRGFTFAWTSGNTIYKRFCFNEDKDLYMSFMDNDKSLEGQAGDNAYYIYHPEEKELEFIGSGKLWYDFNSKAEIPWYKYLIKSDKVILNNGITAKLWTIRKETNTQKE